MDNTENKNRSTNSWDHKGKLSELAPNYQHIKGWGIDADPENEPTYPMKKYTGDDHNRSNYIRPQQQPLDVEILHSNERPTVSAVFGTVSPPSGLSGSLRRFAFRYSEESLKHWFVLVLADRINVLEGIADDVAHGFFPNILAEKGLGAEWKHNQKAVVKTVALTAAVCSVALIILSNKKKHPKKTSWSPEKVW